MASAWEGVGSQNPTMSAASVISAEDILQEVRTFLQGATCKGKVPVESLAQSALFLLQRVPAARNAVLEHFCTVFDDAAKLYIKRLNMDEKHKDKTEKIPEATLQDVTKVLFNFINTNADAWAPIVSSWSLKLLGQISSNYADRRPGSMSNSLSDMLQLWMTCPATKLLMELATECFAAMVGGAPDSCVDALLEASVQYSPHFDWVVARIGSCYPTTIITRVLNCGLKDFCNAGQDITDHDPGVHEKIPKMASVVGILGHLASKHQQDIRKAMMALFEEGLQSSGDSMRVTTLPFLLQLASMSPMLLQVLTTDLITALTPAVLNRLHHQFASWTMSSPAEYNSFLNLVVHLLTKCDVAAFDVLTFILSTAVPSDTGSEDRVLEEVQETCVELIHMLLFELQRGVHSKRREGMSDLPLLDGLSKETDRLVPLLLQAAVSDRLSWLEKLLVFTAVRTGDKFAASLLSRIIIHAATPSQLALYFHLQEAVEKSLKNISMLTADCLFGSLATSQPFEAVQMLKNLQRVVLGEQKRVRILKASGRFLSNSIQDNLLKMCDVLLHPHLKVSIGGLRLLSTVGIPHHTDSAILSRLSAVVVAVFFRMLWARMNVSEDSGEASKEGVLLCHSCIRLLGCLPFSQSHVLLHLLSDCTGQENGPLFGTRGENSSVLNKGWEERVGGSLLKENQSMGLSLQLPRTHASVFHAGVIGQGLKNRSLRPLVSKEWVVLNQDTLLEAVASCCQSSRNSSPSPVSPASHVAGPSPRMIDMSSGLVPSVMSETAARTLGCALVEVVTMDTLYNDVNWPDPEFCKVTLERDLHVWKTMEDNPVLWSVLRAASSSSVFLYYCSPVLKSLMAKIVSTLETTRVKRMSDLPLFYERAFWLVQVLAQGKFLPLPLSSMGELFPYITAQEGCLLLLTVWRYIRENPPVLMSDVMESRKCEPQYSQEMQAVLNANIHTMGHFYPRIFNT